MRQLIRLSFTLVAAALFDPRAAAAQSFTKAGKIESIGAPVMLDTTGMFLARFVRAGDDVFIGGQPTRRALEYLKSQGVTTVVNLRTPEEMRSQVPYDEAALVKELGMKYVYIPMRGNTEYPYAPAALDQFTEAVKNADGKVLLHCTVAWRASHLWAAYLLRERGLPTDQVLAHTRAINLMDDHRMGSNDRQPVEDFLGRSLPGLGRPR